MDFTAWVDVAIGLSVVYLGASLFVTIVNEYLGQLLNLRGRKLATAFKELIGNDAIKEKLKAFEPFQKLLDGKPRQAPSYVDPLVFAQNLLGSMHLDSSIADARERWIKAIEQATTAGSNLQRQLIGVVNGASDTAEGLSKAVSEWADRSLTMLGESYKRWVQWMSFGIGLVIAGSFNIDTIALTTHLYADKEARAAAALVGEQLAEKVDKAQFDQCLALTTEERRKEVQCKPLLGVVEAVQGRNEKLAKLPIGWESTERPAWNRAGFLQVLGWLLTGLALSLGAPFWFDFLNRFVAVRHGMRKPQPDGKASA